MKQQSRFTPISVIAVCLLLATTSKALGQSKTNVVTSVPDLVEFIGQRNIEQIPVDLEAVVNHWDQVWGMFFVQDGDEAIFIELPKEKIRSVPALQTGDVVRVTGTFRPVDYVIKADRVEFVKHGTPLAPLSVRVSGIELGTFWSRRVRTIAQVVSVNRGLGKTTILLDDDGQHFVARVEEEIDSYSVTRLIDSRVEVTGTMGAEIDHVSRDPIRTMIHVMTNNNVSVLAPTLAQTKSDITPTTLRRILKPKTKNDGDSQSQLLDGRLLSFDCVAAHLSTAKFIVFDSDGVSVSVPTENTELIDKGNHVRVVARCQSVDGVVKFSLCTVTRIGEGTLPNAETLAAKDISKNGIERQLIATSGELLSLESIRNERHLILQSGDVKFKAIFNTEDDKFDRYNLHAAKTVNVEGWVETNHNAPSDQPQFTVFMNSGNDFEIVTARAQMDRREAFTIIAALLVAALAGIAAAWLFRLQTHLKTKQLQSLTARLQSTFESIREGILVVDENGQFEHSNKRLQTILGFDPNDASEPIAERLPRCFSDPNAFRQLWNKANNDPTSMHSATLSYSGSGIDGMIVNTVPVQHSSDQPATRLWTFTDICELRKLENQLQQSQKMEAVGRLAGGIAHDFNNLLMVMSGNVEILKFQKVKKTLTETQQDELLAATKSANDRARKLVQQLLGFSRQTALEMTVVKPDQVTSRLSSILRHSLGASVELTIREAPDLWPIRIDTVQIEQVLLNLALNARDALPASGGRITITCENSTAGPLGDAVRFSVSDNGIGMSAETLQQIYEPFFTTKPPGQGTGLGLAMSLGIVEQHMGRIHCESEPGQGTKFDIDFPRSHDAIEIHQFQPRKVSKTQTDRRVFVVDDESAVRKTTSLMLEEFGCSVECASDGQDALEQLAIDPGFDLLIMDMMMPRLSGFDAFGEISRLYPDLPVVMISGYPNDLDRFQAEYDRKPIAHLEKPFQLDDFFELLSRVFEQDSSTRTG